MWPLPKTPDQLTRSILSRALRVMLARAHQLVFSLSKWEPKDPRAGVSHHFVPKNAKNHRGCRGVAVPRANAAILGIASRRTKAILGIYLFFLQSCTPRSSSWVRRSYSPKFLVLVLNDREVFFFSYFMAIFSFSLFLSRWLILLIVLNGKDFSLYGSFCPLFPYDIFCLFWKLRVFDVHVSCQRRAVVWCWMIGKSGV